MKYFYLLLPYVVVSVCLAGCKKDNGVAPKPAATVYKAPANFRVLGYMYVEDAESAAGKNFDLARINYLNIAFFNPDASGNFSGIGALAPMISAAHDKNVKIMASLGGSDAPAYWATILGNATRDAFITTIVQLAVNNNLDGIDIDLEGDLIDANYEAFVTGLGTALRAKGKLLTAAIATWESASFTDNALAAFDFVNVMSYDATGPWDLSDPGPQSPYAMAVSDLNYWGNTRGIAKQKMNLGVPFYGYGFGKGVPEEIDYADIVTNYTGAENRDQTSVKAGGTIYYNGMPTIAKKTTLAMQNAGGVMMWELMGDADGQYSLLNVVDKTANPGNE